ncbi:MAG: SDR family NAD(P)-dependent oxidoreductase [Candidatus Geothermincolia bacterium]
MSLNHAKTAVVTGAGSGIGRALALALAREGYGVGVIDIDGNAAAETVAIASRSGGSAEAYTCDISDFDQVLVMSNHFYDEWGEVGLLLNNAGIGGGGYVGETSIEDWHRVIDINLFGVLNGCHAFIPRMKAAGRGHIVNTASIAGLFPIMGFGPYNASKAAVVSISETIAVELSPFNIGVTVLCPSMVATNIMENSLKVVNIDGYEAGEWGAELINTGLRRSRVTVDDVARMVLEAIERDRLFVVTNLSARMNWLYVRCFTTTYFRSMAYLNKKGLARRILMWAARKGLA